MDCTQLRVTVKTEDIDRTAAIMSMLDNGIMIEDYSDIETGLKLDKDRFRHDNGKVGQAYRTVYERLKEAVK